MDKTLGTLVLAASLSGCVAHTYSPLDTAGTVSPEATLVSSIPHSRAEIPFKNRVLDEEESSLYLVRYVRFPSIGDNAQPDHLVRGKYYESKLPGLKPLVIVLPIWGRHVYPSEKMTAHIKRRSRGRVNVFQMEGENHLIDWEELGAAEQEEAFLDLWRRGAERERVTIIDIRRTIDWAETRPDIDPARIGLLGFSHGAMVAAMTLTQEPRLSATVLVMGGARPQAVLAHCPLARGKPAKQTAEREFGWNRDELEQRLEPAFGPLDPALYPGQVDPAKVLIVEAAKDNCIPPTAREALWQAMGRPARIRLPYSHKQAFLALTPLGFNWLRSRIWRFFDQRWSVAGCPP